MGAMAREDEWLDYYAHFKYLTPDLVRDGSHPQILEHAGADRTSAKAIVLIHGLTDSPHYMRAIAEYFHNQLGYNVYLPLLRGHGLKIPGGMIRIKLRHWLLNVNFAVKTALEGANHVSIGGLSAGGALSFYTATQNNHINGDLYLFSAALDIAGGPNGILGEVFERLLRSPVARVMYQMDKDKPLISRNPFKYARMDKGGAMQLSRLIKKTDRIIRRYKKKDCLYPKRVFAAHSPGDTAADIDGIKALQAICSPDKFRLFLTPANVKHAALVLKDPIYAINALPDEPPIVDPNPVFEDMMAALTEFEKDRTATTVSP